MLCITLCMAKSLAAVRIQRYIPVVTSLGLQSLLLDEKVLLSGYHTRSVYSRNGQGSCWYGIKLYISNREQQREQSSRNRIFSKKIPKTPMLTRDEKNLAAEVKYWKAIVLFLSKTVFCEDFLLLSGHLGFFFVNNFFLNIWIFWYFIYLFILQFIS